MKKKCVLLVSLFFCCCMSMIPMAFASGDGGNCVGEGAVVDDCGDCNGDNQAKDDCGVCYGGNADKDDCGICFGDNKNKDQCGVCFGNNQDLDQCGVCFGNNSAMDCTNTCYGGNILECGYCAPPGQGCQELCKDIVPPQYYKPGLYAGCLPTSCTVEGFHGSGHWALIVDHCPGRFAISQGTLYVSNGMYCGCIRKPDIGCFPPEAMILTLAGEQRIDSLKAGDMVLNPLTGQEIRILKVVQSPEKHPLIEFGYGSERVTVTRTHPVYTRTGLKKAQEVSKGDFIRGSDGEFHEVTSYRLLEPRYGQQVFNLVLDTALARDEAGVHPVSLNSQGQSTIEENLILSDGIVTGDMVLQALLNQK